MWISSKKALLRKSNLDSFFSTFFSFLFFSVYLGMGKLRLFLKAVYDLYQQREEVEVGYSDQGGGQACWNQALCLSSLTCLFFLVPVTVTQDKNLEIILHTSLFLTTKSEPITRFLSNFPLKSLPIAVAHVLGLLFWVSRTYLYSVVFWSLVTLSPAWI